MPTIEFVPKGGDEPSLTVEVPEAGALADVCDVHSAPVPFSCRGASCGTCRIEVLSGAELLLPPEDEELDLLDIFGLKPDSHRLACQTKFRAGSSTLRVRPLDDEV